LCEPSPKSVRRHEVRESALAVDLDHRQPLAVSSLELGTAGDVDLLELELLLGSGGLQHPPRRRAEVAVRGVVEDDSRGYG
jgi:hypothetical protein